MNTFLFSYYIIPFITLRLARGTEYLYSNFSTIRSAFERHLEFLAWCIITGLYFFFSVRQLYRNFPPDSHFSPIPEDITPAPENAFQTEKYSAITQKQENRLPAVAAGLLLVSALLPYLPENLPVFSVLHLLTAFTSSVLLYYCLISLSLRLYFFNPALGRPALLLLIASISFCLSAWIYSGIINTAMEICLVFTACILIRRFTLLFERGT